MRVGGIGGYGVRFWLGAVLFWGLLLGTGSPVRALVIDDFSTGAFNLLGGSGGTTATQVCGSFCLGGSREVFIESGNAILDASVQLFPGDAVNVMPDGGYSHRRNSGTPLASALPQASGYGA